MVAAAIKQSLYPKMPENTPENHEFSEESLFWYTIQEQWEKVLEIYEKYPQSHKTKLDVFGETALNFLIRACNYDSKRFKRTKQIKKMIDCIEKSGSLNEVLSTLDDDGDTTLHIAAFVGWDTICKYIASKDRELISLRNAAGETPLFTAAYYNNAQAFLCLHEIYSKEGEVDESLCRRNDGDTVLHSAISDEDFRLAYQIISYYPKLTNSVNGVGESPLHVLAKKPHLFKSRSQLGFFDSLIYRCVPVAKLKEEKYNRGETNLPENRRTWAKIFLFWIPVFKCISGYLLRIRRIKRQHCHAHQIMSQIVKLTSGHRDDTNPLRPDPDPSLDTRIDVSDIPITSLLTINLIGSTAKSSTETQLEINEKGEDQNKSELIGSIVNSSTEAQLENNKDGEDQNKSGASPPRTEMSGILPPILIAAETGISEMVMEIISKIPEAIREVDPKGKNVLLLAVENRQIGVLDRLFATYSPWTFHKLDNEENSALHLAAMFGDDMRPWRTWCFPLQMSWEIKWYKYVEQYVPTLTKHEKKSARKIFTEKHEKLVKGANKWLTKTSESTSIIAALIASVTFASIATVPGGLNDRTGHPILGNYTAFDVFSVASLFALFLSVTALIVSLAIITSPCEEEEFMTNLPRKLLIGLTSMSASIVAMLVAFCAGHTLILTERLRTAAVPIYVAASLPIMYFVIAQLPLYFDILCAACVRKPLLRYRVMPDQG